MLVVISNELPRKEEESKCENQKKKNISMRKPVVSDCVSCPEIK